MLSTQLPNYQVSLLLNLFGSGLADLLLQLLAHIADALLLVRVRWTEAAHIRRNLSDFLPINSCHRQLGLLGIQGNSYASRQRKFNRVRIAKSEHHGILALQLRAISNADDFQIAVPA